MSHIHLLSTDFDGTLIGHGAAGRCAPVLAEALDRHHRAGGRWAVNTGRPLWHALEGIAALGAPVLPDFFITEEREIYRQTSRGEWTAHGDWNVCCRRRHDELFDHPDAKRLFARIELLAAKARGTRLLYENGRPAGLVTACEEDMEFVAAGIAEFLPKAPPGLHYQRNTIYLRFCHQDHHKGAALGELRRLEGIAAENAFAIGDHFNDLSMLDGRHAAMTACPSNAIDAVKAQVGNSGGYVAGLPWAEGVAESLEYYATKKPRRRTAAACF